jgi:hypothetical protein
VQKMWMVIDSLFVPKYVCLTENSVEDMFC